ncbi:glycosyltransferase family 9 protein [uncultured Psychroserpens sp.]|uniref:glycosyltransferase family 9 protein n=1 Tax=uncultured Psychroserpens sp. TaxID=255436 RepID=UPI002620A12D|nr:glycosyltransferase family 9 protein [uncultured Psychroserpens sp.]
MSKQPKHILVIRLSAMGDVAMTVPVLRALSSQYPTVKVTVLTKPFFKPLFKTLNNVSVFEADIKGKHKGVIGLWKLSRELRRLEFDVVADLHNVLRSKILKYFFFGKKVIQIDKGRQEKKALVSGQNFKQLATTHQRYAEVFEKLGYAVDLDHSTFPKKENLRSKYLQVIGKDSRPWIGIAPFAAFKGKMYPLDSMNKVVEYLSQEYKVLLFGAGNEEAQALNTMANQYDNVTNLAGRFSLDEELDIISNLDLMIAMDSGNAHLAAMLGVKTLTIWGVTHPYAGFLPFNHTIDSAILADRHKFPKIPTSVYGNKLPEGYENAISSITPERIISKITATLN